MIRRESVGIFTLRLAVVYVLLIIPWPKTSSVFSALYRGSCNGFIAVFGLPEYLDLIPSPSNHPRGDVMLHAMNPSGGGYNLEFGSRDWGYLPLATGLALLMAVPPPWPGRLRSGLILLALLALFVFLRVAVASFFMLGVAGVIPLGPKSLRTAQLAMLAFSGTPILTYVVPVILWLIMVYRSFGIGAAKPNPDSGSQASLQND